MELAGHEPRTAVMTPAAEYAVRRERQETQAARLARRHGRLAKGRGVVLALIVLLVVLAEKEQPLTKVVLIGVPALLWAGLHRWRRRTARAWRRAERAAAYYDDRRAWLEGRWAGRGEAGTRFLDEDHPYALDLDLFGAGGLFEGLCAACTRPGEDTLAAWLKAPAPVEEVHARQAAVTELRSRLDLREDLALLRDDGAPAVDLDPFATWGRDADSIPPWARPVALLLSAGALAALAGACLFGTGPLPLLAAFLLEGA